MKSAVGAIVTVICIGAIFGADWECQMDMPYIENECNNCSCSPDKILVCDNTKGCLDPLETKLFNCKVGTLSTKECNNTCECLKDIGTVCTNKPC